MRIVLRHTTILLLEVLAGLLAIIIIAGGILAVRLKDEAPLRLSILTPYLEQGLNELDPNIKVKINETLLTWSGWQDPIDLRARNVQVRDATGRSLATLPDIAISLSVPALLLGQIAPSAIEVVGPRLVVVRTAEGGLQLGFGESDQEATDPFASDLAILLMQPAHERGHLRRISISQASVIVVDRRVEETWRLPMVNFELRRSRSGARAYADARFVQRVETAILRAELAIPANDDPAAANIEVAGLDPRTLAVLAGIPEVGRLHFSVGGALSGLIDRSGAVREAKFSLVAGAGTIDVPELYPEPLPIAGASMRGRLFEAFNRLDLDAAELSILDGPTLTLSANAAGLASPEIVKLEAKLASGAARTETVLRYWPQKLGRAARNWIAENIADGMAEEGNIELVLNIPRQRPENAIIERAEGYFRASGLTVTYLKGLPPLQDVVGEGRLTGNGVSMTVSSGHVGDLVVDSGTVEVASLDVDPQLITIEGQVSGPVSDALELLDRERLGYPRKVGIDPKATSGSARTTLWFQLPGKKDVRIEDVQLRVESRLTDVAMSEKAFGAAVRDGRLDLAVDSKGMTISGTAAIADTSTRLEWRENFGKAEFDTRIVAEAEPDTAARAALGLHAAPWVEGPTPLKILYTRSGTSATADVTADLTKAALAAEPLGWSKQPGVPGKARARIAMRRREVTALTDIAVEAGDLSLAGNVSIGAAQTGPTRITLERLAWGDSRLEGIEASLGNAIDIRIAGGVLDVAPFLEREQDRSEAEEEPGPPFSLSAPNLSELRTDKDRSLAPASIEIAHDGERWSSVDISGGMPGGKTMSLRYGLDPANGRRALRLVSDDAGALLRTARVLETVVGGTLKIEGEAAEPGLAAPLPVEAEVKDYRVVRGKVMAKILEQAKLEDINRLLASEGIPFARFTGKMVLTDETVEIEKARAYGAALGITAQGRIDLESDKIDIEGTIVPAYVVSQIIGTIPLIGRILTGGEGEGLFAATYRAKGPLDDPEVSVNPLAVLAPGFLRGLFNIFDGNDGKEGEEPDFTPLPPREQ
ncbi:MAG TPA: AsmA-like C-terminal domain-containing protein [Alphaproteobacteria bacterium]|nr:AsmA-like C-terminal domain-containing protein [Alphaproteobacteria bacterium]